MQPSRDSARPDTGKRNAFDRMEWAGAFGDLGTLVPFVVAYITLLNIDPAGILLALGMSMVVAGCYYRTPFPVQPMKAVGAIATTQAVQTLTVTAGAVYAATLVSGAAWLLLGVTGTAQRVARWIPRPVVVGMILGLGISFMLNGAKMMAENWWIGAVGLAGTLLLLGNKRVPAMFLLLLFGAICGLVTNPAMLERLADISVTLHWPTFALSSITWSEAVIGVVFLALPQIPLTLGNAIIAITEENNRLFPDRPVSERRVAISTGLMNVGSSIVGGVPLCHGAGGMAGHVRFGARTGGAPIILGVILLIMALLFSESIATLLQLFPRSVLGVILLLTGAQLALGSCDFSEDKGQRLATVVTAALTMWNVGIAFLVGSAIAVAARKGLVRL